MLQLNSETGIVQQPEGLTGQVNNQVQTVENIVGEAVNQPTTEEQEKMRHLELLQGMRICTQTEVTPEQYALTVDGVGFFALGDIHGLKGKQKSGKSAVLKVCAAALLSGKQFRVKSELKEPVVLFIDTEQQKADVKLVVDEMKHMTELNDDYIDSHLLLFTLRRRSYDTLLEDTHLLIDEYRPQVAFIDGLVDYVSSFNDEVMSRELIHKLQMLCEEYGCAIVNVLHENKAADDVNMRGHLGTVLSQKAGSVLQCKKAKSGIINVTCPDARHGQMPAWNICFGNDNHLMDADLIHQQEVQAVRKQKEERRQAERDLVIQQRLDKALDVICEHSGSLLRSELTSTLVERLKLSRPVVSKFITQMVKDGKLFESNKNIMDSSNAVLPF
ncbi:MAG: AAA family ATPase [Bacteroidaceae bacterium]|nr:AAA family ATPase [Bacteroidaceae bacterium]